MAKKVKRAKKRSPLQQRELETERAVGRRPGEKAPPLPGFDEFGNRITSFLPTMAQVSPEDDLCGIFGLTPEQCALVTGALGTGRAGGAGGGGAGRQPFTAPPFQPISEAEIRPTVEAVIQGSEGRVNPATVSAIVAAWQDLFRKHHEQQVGQARAQYEGAPGGATIPQVPSPEAFALQEIRTREPIQTGAYDVVRQGEALKRILGIT